MDPYIIIVVALVAFGVGSLLGAYVGYSTGQDAGFQRGYWFNHQITNNHDRR